MNTNFPHQARKRFGQNFLVDDNIIHNIVDTIHPKPEQHIVEIGPGKGALTQALLQRCPSLTAIELDRDLIANLEALTTQYPKFRLIAADALKIDLADLAAGQNIRVVGNLPYNISTPLIFHLLQYSNVIQDMHFMLQKEVVERLGAHPGTKSYGRLSVMVQYHAEVEQLFTVSRNCFAPPPKVTSAIVRLQPHQTLPCTASNYRLFSELVSTCFQTRRKTLRNNLRKCCDDGMMQSLFTDKTATDKTAIDINRRPETLTVSEFVTLSNQLHQAGCDHAKP